MGVVAVDIGRMVAPDHRAYGCARSSLASPGSAEAHSGDAGGIFAFIPRFSAVRGGLGWYLFVPGDAMWLGRLKRQDTPGWFLTTRMFGHFLCLWCNINQWRRRGVIYEHGADKKAAGKRFHVPATSLEALSAIRQRCQDLKALFGVFNVGNVGMRVVCGYRGGWHGRLVVSRTCGASVVGVVLPES